MDHDKSDMTSETGEKGNASASEGKGSRQHGETDVTGNNSEDNQTAPILQMSQHIFVADSLEDDESMIIPPTQDDTVPFMVPSTPAYEKKSSKREVDPNESTLSVLEETCVDFGNKSGSKDTSADDGKAKTSCNESDLTQDLDDLEPTQPIIPSNLIEFRPDTVKNTEEDEDDNDWQLKFSESQTQDMLNFNNSKGEPDVFPAKESAKPIEEKDDDDDDDLPPTQSIEVPPRIDQNIYDNSIKPVEPSKNIETVEIQSDDEIEPSQSCLLEYKGEAISASYKVQPSKSPCKEMSNDEIPKLQSEVELNVKNSVRDDSDIKILRNNDDISTIALSETGRTLTFSETRSLVGSEVEEIFVPCVDVSKTKIEDYAVNDVEKSVNKSDIEGKVYESKSFTGSPQKNCDKKVIETTETNGGQAEEIMEGDDKNLERKEVDLDKSTKLTEKKSAKSNVMKSSHEVATTNSDDHNNTTVEEENLESLKDKCKIPDEVTTETDQNRNEGMEIDGKEEVQKTRSKDEISCNVQNIDVIQDTSKELESSAADPLQKTESPSLTTSEKLFTDKTTPKSDAGLDTDPQLNKLEGENAEIKQTTDEKFSSPSFLMGPPKSTERHFGSISRQKCRNKTVFHDSPLVEKREPVGSFKDKPSLQKLLKNVGITLDNEKLNTILSSKPNEPVEMKCIYIFENFKIFRAMQFEHHRQDSGASPISSSSTTTSSSQSTKPSIHSGELADCSSSSAEKLPNSQSINIISSQELEMFPKTSTQKSPETKGFSTAFGDNGVVGQFKPDSKVSPIIPKPEAKAATPKPGAKTVTPKRKRGKKNSESTSSSQSLKTNATTRRKRAKKLKATIEEKVEETEESIDPVEEVKPRKATRRKKGKPAPSEIKPEELKAVYDAIPTSTEDSAIQEEEEGTNFGSIIPGVKVMARWNDGYYYSGEVLSQAGDGRWAVRFEDGYSRPFTSENLIKIAILPKGTSVLVQSLDDYYDPGIVCGHFREGNKVGYEVELDNGATKRYSRSAVILSGDQAKLIISSRPPTTPATMTINLDNIVDGKRKRKSVQSPVASPALSRSPRSTTSRSTTSRNTRSSKSDPILDSTADSSSTEVHSDKSEEPIVKKRKINAKGNTKLDTVTASTTPSTSTVAFTSTSTSAIPSTSTGARTSTSDSCKATKSQRSTKKLFKDYAFLLTNADRKVPVFSESEDTEIVPFNKDELCEHIASGGGKVLDKFDDIKKCNRKHIYLLANSYLRTMKYIQCIAAGISCIKHHWVQNCIFKAGILSLNSYILPAGYSLVKQQVIEWHGKTDVFKGIKFALVSTPESPYVTTWAPVLLAAKAEFVQKWSLPSSVSGCSVVIDVLITNNLCPPDIIQAAKKRKIPVVSSEWIIQCLIVGHRLSFDAHPKFKHDYTEM